MCVVIPYLCDPRVFRELFWNLSVCVWITWDSILRKAAIEFRLRFCDRSAIVIPPLVVASDLR